MTDYILSWAAVGN